MKAIAKSVRISPRKANLISGLVRNKKASDALDILKFTPKKGAKLLLKIVASAVANAENNFKQERDTLYIKEIVVTKAPTMKRSVPISRGRVYPILKRNSHITVTVAVAADTTGGSKKAKAITKAADKKAEKAAKAAAKRSSKK